MEVLEDADRSLEIVGGAAETLDAARVLGMGSVGEVETGDVHAGEHKSANHFVGVAGGADGADDFCTARGVGCAVRQGNGGRKISFN